jgi:hypothetical protein
MTEPFAVEPLAQAILAAANLAVIEGMNPRQAHHFFDAEDRDALVRGEMAGAIRLRGKRSLLIQGEVAGTPVAPCRIEAGGDVLIMGGARHAHISARNIYIGGRVQDCRLSAACNLQCGGDLQGGQAEVGAYQLGQAQIEGLKVRVDRARDERERLDHLVSQEEKRLDRACKTTMVPLNFNAGRIVRQEADRISIDLRNFYQSLGKLPEAALTAALDEFLAKGIIGLLARANQRYLSETPTRQKVFLQLLRQLRELFLLVTRRDRILHLLEELAEEIDQLVAQICDPQYRIWVRGQVYAGSALHFVLPRAQDQGDRRFTFSHTTALLQVNPGEEPGQLDLDLDCAGLSHLRQSITQEELRQVGFYSLQGQIFWAPLNPPLT